MWNAERVSGARTPLPLPLLLLLLLMRGRRAPSAVVDVDVAVVVAAEKRADAKGRLRTRKTAAVDVAVGDVARDTVESAAEAVGVWNSAARNCRRCRRRCRIRE